jgi:hypothetical protein
VEQWADNTVIVSESFDTTIAAKLRGAVRDRSAAHAQNAAPDQNESELGFRLYELPDFRAFQAAIGQRIVEAMLATSGH